MHYIYLCIESLSQIWDEVGFGSKRPFSRLYRRRHSIYSCVVHLSRFYVRFFFSLSFSLLSVIGPKFWQLWTRERICFFVVIFRRMRRVYKRRRRRRRGEERTIIDPVNMCAADTIRERKKTKNALTCIIRGFLSLFLVSFFYRWPQFFLFSLYIFAWLLLLMFYVCVFFLSLSSLLVEMNYIIILGWCCCVLLLLLEHFNNLCWFLALVRPFIILCFMRAHIDDILSLWSITMPNVFSSSSL